MSANIEKKIDTREVLLETAEQLFATKCFAEVSTREIAEHAQVNLGAIQYHFGSKSQLFIETINRMFERQQAVSMPIKADKKPGSRVEAIFEIANFISFFLKDMFFPEGPQACKLMYREILSGTCEDPELKDALVTSVVEKFIRPLDERLCEYIRIIKPKLNQNQAGFVVQSIVGQCSFYLTNRDFFERLRRKTFNTHKTFAEVRSHVVSFTLTALEVSADEINLVINQLNVSDKLV